MPKGCYDLSKRSRGRRLSLEDRFWSKVDRSNECWVWMGAIFTSGLGYGQFQYRGQPKGAHRVSWFLTHGIWPEKDIAHSCDNPRCVRPDHLFEATPLENNRDMIAKGRQRYPGPKNPARGDRHRSHLYPQARPRGAAVNRGHLRDPDILEIRSAYAAGETQMSIARRFNVSQGTVSMIVLRKTWTHL